MKDRGVSRKLSREYIDFTENLRATRRSKAIGTDKKMITQLDASTLIVNYFKENNDRFLELIKMEFKK